VTNAGEDQEFSLRGIAVAAFGPAVLFGVSQGAMLPVVAISAVERGASLAVASLVVSLIGIGAIASNIPAGILTTRFGERRSMVAAAVITAAGLGLCVADVGLWLFSVGILLVGCASAVFNLARQSYLTVAVPAHMRARAMSTLGGTQRIGVFVGPFLGAGMLHLMGLRGAYLLATVAVLAAGVIAYTVPDLDEPVDAHDPASPVTTAGMLRVHWRTYAFLGFGVFLLSAIRGTRQVVVPLWAHHLGLSAADSSIIYGIAGVVDALMFYPSGKVMDHYGRKWIAVPSCLIMGLSFVLVPLTHGPVLLAAVAMVMGLGNGAGSGIINTLGADVAPATGRLTFLGIWREMADAGQGIGPVILSVVTSLATLAAGIVVSGLVGFAAAAALWRWIPKRVAGVPMVRPRRPEPADDRQVRR